MLFRLLDHEAQQLAGEQAASPPPKLSMALGGMAELLCEWNDLEATSHYVTEAIALGQPTGDVGILAIIYRALARVQQAQGGVAGALERALSLAEEISLAFGRSCGDLDRRDPLANDIRQRGFLVRAIVEGHDHALAL